MVLRLRHSNRKMGNGASSITIPIIIEIAKTGERTQTQCWHQCPVYGDRSTWKRGLLCCNRGLMAFARKAEQPKAKPSDNYLISKIFCWMGVVCGGVHGHGERAHQNANLGFGYPNGFECRNSCARANLIDFEQWADYMNRFWMFELPLGNHSNFVMC